MNTVDDIYKAIEKKEQSLELYKLNNIKYLLPCYENLKLDKMPRMPGDETNAPFLAFDAKNNIEARNIIDFIGIKSDHINIEHGVNKYNMIDFYLEVCKEFDTDNDKFKIVFMSDKFNIRVQILLNYLNINNFKYITSITTTKKCNYDVNYNNNQIIDINAKCLKYHGINNTINFKYYPNDAMYELLEKINIQLKED